MFASTVVLAFTGLTAGARECNTICPDIYMPVCCINGGKNITFANDCELKVYECEHPGKSK